MAVARGIGVRAIEAGPPVASGGDIFGLMYQTQQTSAAHEMIRTPLGRVAKWDSHRRAGMIQAGIC
ncbi:hypothetical protein, partial [Pseudooceanicola sp.]|uniref:hypothetical protein n=1 Tax=Pseudooceanicola sp. TaxID=1914328 RepID=UPI002639F107